MRRLQHVNPVSAEDTELAMPIKRSLPPSCASSWSGFGALTPEKKDLAEQQKEVNAEAKGRGLIDTKKILPQIIALRKARARNEPIAKEEAVLDMYKRSLGHVLRAFRLSLDENVLGTQAVPPLEEQQIFSFFRRT